MSDFARCSLVAWLLAACAPAASEGTSDSSTFEPDPGIAARNVAIVIDDLQTFLWNRDLMPQGEGSLQSGGNCLLGGSYTASGSSTVDGDCASGTSTATRDVTFEFSGCEHEGPSLGDSIVFDGTLRWQDTSIYVNTCTEQETSNGTFTSTALDAVGYVSGEVVFEDCTVELNFSEDELQGRFCEHDVLIEYAD